MGIKIKLGKVLEEKHKSRYWLIKQIHGTAQSLNKLINNESCAIYFETLEKICLALDCEVEDIIVIDRGENTNE